VWRASTVRAILANPIYAGRIRSGDDEFEADVDRCRSDEVHAAIQKMLANPSSVSRGRLPNGNFLFRRGMLRCGQCGYAMTSRTDRRYRLEKYLCSGRMIHGVQFCDMPSVKRVDVDSAVYRYFEQVALDVEATREAVAEARDRKLAEVRALRDEAETEVRRAEERLARVRRDYTDGKIDAEDWREFREELGAERDAAQAEAKRLATQQREVQAWGELRDAEAETWRRLSEIRAVIAGDVRDAKGLDAVRAALGRTFEHFIVRPSVPRVHIELIADAGLVIDPVVREQAVAGYTENLRPVLRRESLKEAGGLHLEGPPIFGPIKVGAA
jgi:hypothetical protein